MRTNDQRAIIEQLLGITILSEKAESLKDQVKQTKESITEETAKINAIQSANSHIEETIKSLRTKQSAWNAKKQQDLTRLQQGLVELEHLDIDNELDLHEKLAQWSELNNAKMALNKEKSTLESALLQADKRVKKVEKDVLELDNAMCYACNQPLHEDKKQEILAEKAKELEESMAYQNDVNTKLSEVIKNINDIGDIDTKPNTFYDTAKEAYEHRNNVETLKQTLSNKEDETDPYESQIQELTQEAIQEIDWSSVNNLNELKDHQEFLLKLLTNKDSFIRKKIIEQNLAYLNNRLTYYLDKLGLPHQVIFQNDLAVEITQLGQDLDFDNLSRGERNRLILGLSFAFRDVWESLYQNINLLFIDELIDSGMDTAGVEGSLSVLKKIAREREKNIFLISHKDELVGRVNTILKVVKENGFTSYENDLEVID
jgi:DNA repair exonuclease SbcCD ATPase subunit